MSKLPALKARDLIRVLEGLGFRRVRAKGFHIFFKHSDSRTTLVPSHGSEDIGKELLRQILREIKVNPEEFSKLL